MKHVLSLLLLFSFLSLRAIAPQSSDEDYSPSEEATHVPAMIMVADEDVEESIDYLQSQGVKVLHHRKNIILAFIPIQGINELNKKRGIRANYKIEYSKPRYNKPMMREARHFFNADFINEGLNLPAAYSGKGVVVGVCDIGIDTRHPNFLTADGKECRIRRAIQYIEDRGERNVYSTPEEIYEWETDNPDDWHATHVTGIAAGGHKESGFYSLAYDADIVFSASQLSDVGLLAGVEDIIEYAKEIGKPAVVNLSMGNYVGPHDGTSLFARYLDYCAEDAIICISAGNEGEGGQPRSLSFDFTDEKSSLEVLPNDWGGTNLTGEAEIWSRDNTPFNFTFYLHDDTKYSDNLYPFRTLEFPRDAEGEWRISADPEDEDYNADFAAHYNKGYVVARGGISPLNGRFYVNLKFEGTSDQLHPGSAWAEYWPGIKIEAEPGAHVDVFCAGGSFLRQERNNPAPDNKLCISDLATGFKTISVGMMNNTDIYDNQLPGSGYAKGDVSAYSSYGTLNDGRVFPLTVAPGAYMISSISSPYLEAHPEDKQYTDYNIDFNGKTVYWIGTLGTSMSCPYVVGAIACWLEAYPNLSSEEAVNIVAATNVKEGYPDQENPRHGQGWFDAYSGMHEVMKLSALNVSSIEDNSLKLAYANKRLTVSNLVGTPLTLKIYTPDGSLRELIHLSPALLSETDLSHLPSGIYILTVSSGSATPAKLKIAI